MAPRELGSLPTKAPGLLHPGDYDCYRFSLAAAQHVQAEVKERIVGDCDRFQAVLSFHGDCNDPGTYLATAHQGGRGRCPRLETVLAAGTYRACVGSIDGQPWLGHPEATQPVQYVLELTSLALPAVRAPNDSCYNAWDLGDAAFGTTCGAMLAASGGARSLLSGRCMHRGASRLRCVMSTYRTRISG